MVIFHSYVSLPEGKIILTSTIPMTSQDRDKRRKEQRAQAQKAREAKGDFSGDAGDASAKAKAAPAPAKPKAEPKVEKDRPWEIWRYGNPKMEVKNVSITQFKDINNNIFWGLNREKCGFNMIQLVSAKNDMNMSI